MVVRTVLLGLLLLVVASIAINQHDQKLEVEQMELYFNKVEQIEKTIKEAENMHAKPIRLEDNPIDDTVGDVVMNEEELRGHHSNRTKRQAYTRGWPTFIWVDGIVPYFFDRAFSTNGRNFVKQAMRFYEENTCIRFKEVDQNVKNGGKIRIFRGNGCYSNIGYSYKEVQDLSLTSGCERFDSSCHELGHALGFIHAHTRWDRDDWIWVDTTNIQERYKSEYEKWAKSDNDNFGMRYDYRSIMHYKPTLWAINPKKDVMVAHDSKYQQALGSSQIPVFTDIFQLNKLCSCEKHCAGENGSQDKQCARGGYPNPNDCSKCHCPSGFGGDDCSERQPPSQGLSCGDTLTATAEWQVLKQNNVCGNGQYATANLTAPSLCTYHVEAQCSYYRSHTDKKDHDALCFDRCFYGGLDTKGHTDDWQPEGYRLCCPAQFTEAFKTVSNLRVVQAYNYYRYTDFQITYRLDPSSIVTTTAQPEVHSTVGKRKCRPARRFKRARNA